MSGHSKWHNIKNQKGATDQRRGLEFTKLSNAITIAVKTSGGSSDPETNFKLRLLVEKAKSVNMPKEKIQRAIDRAKGPEAGTLEEVIYEGFGPAGIAVLIEAATDNRQRTAQEIKNLLETSGGSLAGPGATAYLFKNVGMITIPKSGKTLDELMDRIIEAGAEDLEEAEEDIFVYTRPEAFHQTQENLKKAGLEVLEPELIYKPNATILIASLETAQKILAFMGKAEDNESVQRVFANFEISNEIIDKL